MVFIINKTFFRSANKVLLLLGFALITFAGRGQDDIPKNEIKVLARVQGDKILLRWASTTPSSWLRGNTYGYEIERFTVLRNGELLSTPEKRLLTNTPILPLPIELWEDKVEQNDYAAILAQAIYGESFEVEQLQGGLAQIINTSQEIEQRFSFGLFAADLNFDAAKMGALGYEDTDIKANEEYLYKIVSKVPEELLKIEPGIITVKVIPADPLPAPIDIIAVSDDKSIMLTWEYDLFKTIYNAYFVERSENGKDFKRLGDLPLVNLNDKPESPARRMFYIDTISQNNKIYHYRVIGISPFGETSQPSKTVSAQGIKKLTSVPHISRHIFDAEGNIILKWDFAESAEAEITGFELNWAAQEKGPYKVVKTNIPPHSRTITYLKPEPSNYFRIAAIGKNIQQTASLTAFVQTIDSIPPGKPISLEGVIDTLGVVRLKWKANIEKDLLGYRVFRGNLDKEEVSQITIAPISENSFVDTVQVKSLNSKVFYQVVAVDQRFNMSEYSDKMALLKPDVVPPSSPIFKTYKVTKEGILLQWINSTSEDVVTHKLFRQQLEEADKGWEVIFKTDTTATFRDEKVKPGVQYRYAIFAEDTAGLQSDASTPVTVTSKNRTNDGLIKGFNAVEDRVNNNITLTWRKLSKDVTEILIYKSKNDELPIIWKQMPNVVEKITDTSVSPGNIYIYQMKVFTKQGNYSTIITKKVNY